MARTESILVAPLPRRVLVIGTPVAALLLTAFFIALGFPYHELTNRVAARAAASLGVEIEAARSSLTLGLDGPGLRFEDVSVELPTGEIYNIDSARLGPAWSLSWFAADPSYFFEIRSPLGTGEGIVRNGDSASWSGSIAEASLAELTFLEPLLPFKLTGTLDAEGDVVTRDGFPHGPLSIDLRDGVLGHSSLPFEISYATIQAGISFGGEELLRVEAFELRGPTLEFSIAGTVGRAEKFGDQPLDLDVTLEKVTPQIRSLASTFGVRLGSNGPSTFHLGGTAGNPRVE